MVRHFIRQQGRSGQLGVVGVQRLAVAAAPRQTGLMSFLSDLLLILA